MTQADRAAQVAGIVGSRIFVSLTNRPNNPPENYVLEGRVIEADYVPMSTSDLSVQLWVVDGYYANLDNGDDKVEFRAGHRESIILTDVEFDSILLLEGAK